MSAFGAVTFCFSAHIPLPRLSVGVLKKGGVLLSSTLLVCASRSLVAEFLSSFEPQVTGILGTKAYRCLSNAGFVVVVLAFLRASIIAVSGVVIAEYRGGRRFTGVFLALCRRPPSNYSQAPATPSSNRIFYRSPLFCSLWRPASFVYAVSICFYVALCVLTYFSPVGRL